jgi:asparagine synthase (glutamine-hydrolysing)
MITRQCHRGPDGSGTYAGSHAALGNARLWVVDKAGGSQPMVSADGRWAITYNGEVFNYRELRAELCDQWDFRSDCDTEVVLAAMALWGRRALHRFNGMFAFFLWDNLTQTGFGARDRLGVKPFVYSFDEQGFAFASEAKALIGMRRPVADVEAILEYLVAPYFSGVEHTPFAGVACLPPGHCCAIDVNGLHIDRWWRYELHRTDPEPRREQLARQIAGSVSRAAHTEHRLASFLSGGLDSTLITALAAHNGGSRPTAYTVQFEDQAHFDYTRSRIVQTDDTPFAIRAARALGVEHHLVHVDRNCLADDLRTLAAINDALPAWEQELAQHHLARRTAAECKVVLVGDAADETHFGYSFLLDREVTRGPANVMQRFGFPPIQRNLCPDPLAHFTERYRAVAVEAGDDWETPERGRLASTRLIIERWLPRLLHNGDIHTMAFSLEARVPFSDIDLLSIAERVPAAAALDATTEKKVLREAARGLLPEENRLRRKSALPKDQETAVIYQREAANALRESARFLGTWLDLDSLRALCVPNRALNENERSLLFRVIVLHHWQQHYDVRAP